MSEDQTTGNIYVYLTENKDLCKIGITKNWSKRAKQHKKDPYYGVMPSLTKEGNLRSFSFKIKQYKTVESTFKSLLRRVGTAELYIADPVSVYKLLVLMGGKEEENNTGISFEQPLSHSKSWPKEMEDAAENVINAGNGKELLKLKYVASEDEYNKFNIRKKSRYRVLTNGAFLCVNYNANDSSKFVEEMRKLAD